MFSLQPFVCIIQAMEIADSRSDAGQVSVENVSGAETNTGVMCKNSVEEEDDVQSQGGEEDPENANLHESLMKFRLTTFQCKS